MYSRAFFIRAIARWNYPRVYSRHINDLRMLSTSSLKGFHALHEFRVDRTRGPHWKRVAIVRHEFYQKFGVAPAAPRFASGTGSSAKAISLSPSATTGSVVDLTTSALRPIGCAPHDRSAKVASSGCPASATVPLPRGGSSHLLLALPTGESSPARASERPCSA